MPPTTGVYISSARNPGQVSGESTINFHADVTTEETSRTANQVGINFFANVDTNATHSQSNAQQQTSNNGQWELQAIRRQSFKVLTKSKGFNVDMSGEFSDTATKEALFSRIKSNLGAEHQNLRLNFTRRTISYQIPDGQGNFTTVVKDVEMFRHANSESEKQIFQDFDGLHNSILQDNSKFKGPLHRHQFGRFNGDLRSAETVRRPSTEVFSPHKGWFSDNSDRLVPTTLKDTLYKTTTIGAKPYMEIMLEQSENKQHAAQQITYMHTIAKTLVEKIYAKETALRSRADRGPAEEQELQELMNFRNELSQNLDEFAMAWAIAFMPIDIPNGAEVKTYKDRAETSKNELLKVLQAQQKKTGWFGTGEREPLSEQEKTWAKHVGALAIPVGKEHSRLALMDYAEDSQSKKISLARPNFYMGLILEASHVALSSNPYWNADDERLVKEMIHVQNLQLSPALQNILEDTITNTHSEVGVINSRLFSSDQTADLVQDMKTIMG